MKQHPFLFHSFIQNSNFISENLIYLCSSCITWKWTMWRKTRNWTLWTIICKQDGLHWKAKSVSLKTALNRYLESPVFHTVNEKQKEKGHTPPRYGGDEHKGTHSQRQTRRHLEESRVDVTSRLSQTMSVCVWGEQEPRGQNTKRLNVPKMAGLYREEQLWRGWGAGCASQYICSDVNRHLSLLGLVRPNTLYAYFPVYWSLILGSYLLSLLWP